MTPERILKAVEEETGVTREELMGPRRDLHVSQARRTAMYLCRELCKMSYASIGTFFAGRDHTTVLAAIRPGKLHNYWFDYTVPAVKAALRAQGAAAPGQNLSACDSCVASPFEATP